MCRKASAMWVPLTKINRTLFSEDPKNNINYRVSLILQYIISHNEMSWLVDSLSCSPYQDSKLSCLVYHSTVVAHLESLRCIRWCGISNRQMCRKASAMWVGPIEEENRTLFSEDPENNVNCTVSLFLQYIISHNEMNPVTGWFLVMFSS